MEAPGRLRIVAGLLSAAVAPTVLVAVPAWSLALTAAVFAVALAHAILLGLPAYLMLRRRWRLSLVSALFGGFAVALPVVLLAPLAGEPDFASAGGIDTVVDGTRTTYGWLRLIFAATIAGVLGAAGGLAFWAVVRTDEQAMPR